MQLAILIIDDDFLKKELRLFRWQHVEILRTTNSRHKKTPTIVYHCCRILKSNRMVHLKGNEIELLNNEAK